MLSRSRALILLTSWGTFLGFHWFLLSLRCARNISDLSFVRALAALPSVVAQVVTRATADLANSFRLSQSVTMFSQCHPCIARLWNKRSRVPSCRPSRTLLEHQLMPNGPNTCNCSAASPGTSEESRRSGKGVEGVRQNDTP